MGQQEFDKDAALFKTQVQAYLSLAEAKAMHASLKDFTGSHGVRKLWHELQPIVYPGWNRENKTSILDTVARLLPKQYRAAFEEFTRQAESRAAANAEEPGYIHRGISRNEAEKRLYAAGAEDGMFLVKEESGEYDLILIFRGRCVHFRVDWDKFVNKFTINRQSYGESTTIPKLIENLQKDGLTKGWVYPLTKPVVQVAPPAFPAPAAAAVPAAAAATQQTQAPKQQRVFGSQSAAAIAAAAATAAKAAPAADEAAVVAAPEVDESLPEFMHGTISRMEAEARAAGRMDGSFLVRKKADKHYVLTLVMNKRPCHFPLDWDPLLNKFTLNKKSCGHHEQPEALVQHVMSFQNWEHKLLYPVSRKDKPRQAPAPATTTTPAASTTTTTAAARTFTPAVITASSTAKAPQTSSSTYSAPAARTTAAPAVVVDPNAIMYAELELGEGQPTVQGVKPEEVIYAEIRSAKSGTATTTTTTAAAAATTAAATAAPAATVRPPNNNPPVRSVPQISTSDDDDGGESSVTRTVFGVPLFHTSSESHHDGGLKPTTGSGHSSRSHSRSASPSVDCAVQASIQNRIDQLFAGIGDSEDELSRPNSTVNSRASSRPTSWVQRPPQQPQQQPESQTPVQQPGYGFGGDMGLSEPSGYGFGGFPTHVDGAGNSYGFSS